MITKKQIITVYLLFSVSVLISITINLYWLFFRAMPTGFVLVSTNTYHEMWPETVMFITAAPGIIKCCHHLMVQLCVRNPGYLWKRT